MKSIRTYAEVQNDLDEIWFYIARENPAAADRVIDAAERTFSQIAQHPEIGWERRWKNQKLARLRSWRVEGYPDYLVFYRIEGESIAVVAVLHGMRRFERILRKRRCF